MSNQWKKLGLSRLVSATQNSLKGIKLIYQTEAAFRQELALILPLSVAAFFVGETATEITLLLLVGIMVLLMEIINSAIEAVVDRIGLEHHELSGKAKDLGSLAVMLSLLLAIITWAIILVEKYFCSLC